MKLAELKTKAECNLYRAEAALTVACATILSAVQPVSCGDDWTELAKDDKAKNIFYMIGSIYLKWAWLPGVIAAIMFMIKRGQKDGGEAPKKVLIGIIAGYVVFGIGAAVWVSLFNSFGSGSITDFQ